MKALVRYNTAGDAEPNAHQRERLTILQRHLNDSGRSFMLELLVPPTPEQAAAHGPSFDDALRPELTIAAIDERLEAGAAARLVEARGQQRPRGGGRNRRLRLGRSGARRASCSAAARTATASRAGSRLPASVDGFVGFAVGRTLWMEAFAQLVRKGSSTSARWVERIATAYLDTAAAYRRTAAASLEGAHDRG